MRSLDGITDSKDMSLSKFRETVRTEEPGMLQSMESKDQTCLETELHRHTCPLLHQTVIRIHGGMSRRRSAVCGAVGRVWGAHLWSAPTVCVHQCVDPSEPPGPPPHVTLSLSGPRAAGREATSLGSFTAVGFL